MNPNRSSSRREGQSPADDLMDDWLLLSSDSVVPQDLEVKRDDPETEDRGQFKSRLISAWNSVKYGEFYRSDVVTVLFCYHENRSVRSLLVCEMKLFLFYFNVSGWSLKQKSKFKKSSPVVMFGQNHELKDHGEALAPPETVSFT